MNGSEGKREGPCYIGAQVPAKFTILPPSIGWGRGRVKQRVTSTVGASSSRCRCTEQLAHFPLPSLALVLLLNGAIPGAGRHGQVMHGGRAAALESSDVTLPPGTL